MSGLMKPIGRLAEPNSAGWGAIVDINLKGDCYASRAASPVMLAQRSGTKRRHLAA